MARVSRTAVVLPRGLGAVPGRLSLLGCASARAIGRRSEPEWFRRGAGGVLETARNCGLEVGSVTGTIGQ